MLTIFLKLGKDVEEDQDKNESNFQKGEDNEERIEDKNDENSYSKSEFYSLIHSIFNIYIYVYIYFYL